MTVYYIVTGFSAFQDVPDNPTESLVLRLRAVLDAGSVRLEGACEVAELTFL